MKLRDQVIRLAHTNPEMRMHLLPLLKEAAKATPKLKGKKLDKEVNACFYRFSSNIEFDIFDLNKIAKMAQDAYEAASTHEEGITAMDEAMQKAVAKYRQS